MRIAPVSFYCAKGMFYNGLPPFVILWVLLDVVIINVYCILIFAALYDAFGKFGTLIF